MGLPYLWGCVSRCFGQPLRDAFFFVLGLRVRGGSVLSARSVAVLAILSAYCLAFLVGFRLTSALTFPDIAL